MRLQANSAKLTISCWREIPKCPATVAALLMWVRCSRRGRQVQDPRCDFPVPRWAAIVCRLCTMMVGGVRGNTTGRCISAQLRFCTPDMHSTNGSSEAGAHLCSHMRPNRHKEAVTGKMCRVRTCRTIKTLYQALAGRVLRSVNLSCRNCACMSTTSTDDSGTPARDACASVWTYTRRAALSHRTLWPWKLWRWSWKRPEISLMITGVGGCEYTHLGAARGQGGTACPEQVRHLCRQPRPPEEYKVQHPMLLMYENMHEACSSPKNVCRGLRVHSYKEYAACCCYVARCVVGGVGGEQTTRILPSSNAGPPSSTSCSGATI